MSRFFINGTEQVIPKLTENTFGQLLRHIHTDLVNENALISALKVNGVEIAEADERALAAVPLTDLNTIELLLTHPVLLAEDTLKTLAIYGGGLADLSRRIADELEAGIEASAPGGGRIANHDFRKLIDGLQTFAESIESVSQVIIAEGLPEVGILEQEMMIILRLILASQENDDLSSRVALLREKLPSNLDRWLQFGIPALLRAANEGSPAPRASITSIALAAGKRAGKPRDGVFGES